MFTILSLILGLSMLVVAAAKVRKRLLAKKSQHTAQGLVVRFRCERAVRESQGREAMVKQYYYPIVEFTTSKGKVVVFQDPSGSQDSPQYSPGQKVKVRYDGDNPENARLVEPLRA